jgi:Na+/H+-translocating membrane pyrophosphatase
LRLEALIVLLLVAYLVVAIFFSHVTHPSALIGEIIFGIAGAIGLYVASLGYANRKSYGRAPSVLANAIALGVSYFMFSGGFYLGAVPLLILALPTFFACLFGYTE